MACRQFQPWLGLAWLRLLLRWIWPAQQASQNSCAKSDVMTSATLLGRAIALVVKQSWLRTTGPEHPAKTTGPEQPARNIRRKRSGIDALHGDLHTPQDRIDAGTLNCIFTNHHRVRLDLVNKFCKVANVGQSRPSLLPSQRQQGAPGSGGSACQRSPRSPPRAGP